MKRLIALGIFGVFLFFSLTILAQVPQLLNYQGRLTDDKGIPIITTTTVRLSLYQGGDAATPGSGTLCYQEDASVTPDDNGVFSHLIGSGTVISGALDATVFQTASPVFLEIAIDPAGANETLLPRKQIVTVGYSFKSELADDADTVDGQDASAFAPVVHNHDPDYVNEGQADSVNSSMIVNGTIVDADINAGANIAGSKIDPTGLDADLLDGKDSEDFVHTAGDNMTGTLNVTSPAGYAVYGSAPIHGVYGISTNTTGTNWGVCGEGVSPGAWGVFGTAPVYGVYGLATATSGTNYGLYGESASASGRGVYGTAPFYGVYGVASATTGITFGVYGTTASNSHFASGVYGYATATNGDNSGVFGATESNSGRGVYGVAWATNGITYGVYGVARTMDMGYGVYGESLYGYGVYGLSNNIGVYGLTYGQYAVYGKNSNPSGGYAGYFEGRVHVTGDLTVGGSKPCVQPIDNGKKVLLYAMESPEIWFEDFGTAQLVNGQAVVQLESVFTQAANTEIAYFVFPIPNGECNGLYISRKDNNSFE
ncbi:hypothetical protein CEE39_03300, partial [bacterium (candidate division B38) B3_B38]